MRVCALVLTRNRAEMLEHCLEHLAAQTRAPEQILVVDNGSTDETPAVLERHAEAEALRLEKNLGGPGGYAHGLGVAFERGFDWVWLLDDDAFAEPECLEALIDGVERAPRRPALVTSVVRWRDSRIHPMNRPWLRVGREAALAEAAAAGLAEVRAATSVSTMVSRDALERHGFPPTHYEIWIDDIEWTAKILRESTGYLVPDAVTVHHTAEPRDTVDEARGRFYYKVRNGLWMLRAGESFRGQERLAYALSVGRAIRRYVAESSNRGEAVLTVARGLRDGLRPEPR